MAKKPIQEVDDMGVARFMPDVLDKADGVTLVPAAVDTPIKSVSVIPPLPKERMKAVKPWKPIGRR